MYKAYFALDQEPFKLTVDPAFLFLTEGHRQALAGLTYGIFHKKGCLVLTGDAGTGKTMLVAKELKCFSSGTVRSSLISNPTLTRAEFLEMVLLGFGIIEKSGSKAQRLFLLEKMLRQTSDEGKISALVVDEAHKLSPDLLEEIRLLGNLEHASEKLLQVVLVGQTELDLALSGNDMRQFRQRVAVRMSIRPLAGADVGNYIAHRWGIAGGIQPPPFSARAIEAIAGCSSGVPRVINGICDSALVIVFAEGKRIADEAHVLEAWQNLKRPEAAALGAVALTRKPEPDQKDRSQLFTQSAKTPFWNRWTTRFVRT